MSDDLDAQWEEWLSEGGSLIEKEIEEEIIKAASLKESDPINHYEFYER